MTLAKRSTFLAGLVCLAAISAGCRQSISEFVVEAPNYGVPYDTRLETRPGVLDLIGVDRELFVAIDHPPATIRAWIIEPRRPRDAEPRGTVLVLHGFKVPSFWMLVKGNDLAGAGYRVVMVDSRGHGGSTGNYVTFGVQESRDLVAVVDALEAEGLVAGRIGVWGISLGAATAIQFAARDSRIDAVVAIAPYATFRATAAGIVRRFVPFNGRWSDADLDAWIDEAGRYAGFDPDDASPIAAIPAIHAPVLIVCGRWDMITPIENAQALHAVAETSESIELPATGHILAGMDLGWRVKRASIGWFDRFLVDDVPDATGEGL